MNNNIQWSEAQENIFLQTSAAPLQSFNIRAVAGSGKTTTMIEAMKRISSDSFAIAFNKIIAVELQNRGANAKTFNAHGYGECRKRGLGHLDTKKLTNIARDVMGIGSSDLRYSLKTAVGRMKNAALGLTEPDRESDTESIIPEMVDLVLEHSTVNIPKGIEKAEFIAYAIKLFELSVEDFETIDFDDQVYLPLKFGWMLDSSETIFVDEAQDLSPLQHLYVERLARKRMIAFGDPRQAIYAFRGADSNSMSRMAEKFASEWLPLTCTFRCPQAITELAREIEPEIYCPKTAIEGIVARASPRDLLLRLDSLASGTLVLCRNNAPLFHYAMFAVIDEIPFKFQGNFAKQLKGPIYSFDATSKTDFFTRLDSWEAKKIQYYLDMGWDSRVSFIKDQADALRTIGNLCLGKKEMLKMVDKLTTDETGIIFSTIHQAKGLEAPDVYLVQPELIGDGEQEKNLEYVAITRSSENLWFVED